MVRISAFLLLLLCGCGYQFQGGGSILPADIQRVYVPMVVNNTPESTLTNILTEALRDRFERYGVLYVVEDLSEADAILEAKIIRVGRDTRTVSRDDIDLQLDTVLIIEGELRRVTGPVLWRNQVSAVKSFGTASAAVVTSSAEFSASSISQSALNALDSRELSRGQETEVFENLSDEIARRVYDEAVAPDF